MFTGILSLLMALTFSLLITRIAAVALVLTGLSEEAASFQARSAFSGVGFTTDESESIVNHPVRRRIIQLLMLLGNVGIATVAATVIVSLTNAQAIPVWQQAVGLGVLLVGLVLLWLFWSSKWLERRMNAIIAWTLRRWTKLDVRDYVALLQLAKGFAVTEILVEPGDWLADKSLKELRLPDEGVLVLGIHSHNGDFLGTPVGDDVIRANDTLILYGAIDRIAELDQRRAGGEGDRAHVEAVQEQAELEEAVREEGLADEVQA